MFRGMTVDFTNILCHHKSHPHTHTPHILLGKVRVIAGFELPGLFSESLILVHSLRQTFDWVDRTVFSVPKGNTYSELNHMSVSACLLPVVTVG